MKAFSSKKIILSFLIASFTYLNSVVFAEEIMLNNVNTHKIKYNESIKKTTDTLKLNIKILKTLNFCGMQRLSAMRSSSLLCKR